MADTTAPPSSYTPYHKRYYEKHRARILENRRNAKPWTAYYARHAESERARKRDEYARKKAESVATESHSDASSAENL